MNSAAAARGPGLPEVKLPPPASTGIPLSERFKAVKEEALKKPQIQAGGFGYGMNGMGVPNYNGAGAGSFPGMGGFAQFYNNVSNGFFSHDPRLVRSQPPPPPPAPPVAAAALRNNMQFTRMLAAKMAAAALRKNQFVNGSIMGRPNLQSLQAQKAPVLARIGTPKNIVKKKLMGSGGGRGGTGMNQLKQMGNRLVIEKGIVGGGRVGRTGSRQGFKNAKDGKWVGEARSKESLDQELDSYMAASKNKNKKKGKGDLDEELEQYMLEAAKARAKLNALSVSESVAVVEATSTKNEVDQAADSVSLDESILNDGDGEANLTPSDESAMLE